MYVYIYTYISVDAHAALPSRGSRHLSCQTPEPSSGNMVYVFFAVLISDYQVEGEWVIMAFISIFVLSSNGHRETETTTMPTGQDS